MKRIFYILILLLVYVFTNESCKKADNFNRPLSPSQGTPDQVTNVLVKNDSAKAIITYSLPNNADLAYVKAVYLLKDGSTKEVKASIYANSLVCDGFGDTLEHEIQLYSVNKAEVISKPVSIKVKPLENPIWGVYRSLTVTPDFAGMRIQALNLSRYNIAIEVYKDSLGDWTQYSGIYTSTDTVNSPIRGLDTIPQKIAITVRDKFMNRTDTLFTTLTPYYETILSKSLYREYTLPGDATKAWSSNYLSYLWDGDKINWPYVYITKDDGKPAVITFDLGQTVKLSRLVTWDYPEYLNSGRTYYYGGNPRVFEIWGSNAPALDGSWASWTKLADCTEIKPSGLAYGAQSDEDYNKAYAGFSWDLNPTAPKMRYIRIRVTKNWAGTSYLSMAELTAYGDPR